MERCGGARLVAKLCARFAKRSPSRCECRRYLDGLRKQISRSGMIAAGGKIAPKIVAPVRDQIARRGCEKLSQRGLPEIPAPGCS